ncbi:glutaminase A [Desulfovibrio sp. JC010]|uniref:glutaminase A n=1 Tax=Desulfovibrio sp. JC010 TaxID=2593641 RepID=UPI0013D76D23|nr:glutaminase A [Desulfovibrio sp. JC010]NDV26529.1 glutaminase A [Desulfovibrio sp. JC010]
MRILFFLLIIFLLPLNAHAKLIKSFSDEVVRQTLQTVYNQCRSDTSGKVADYIPALAKGDPKHFGIVICTVDGKMYKIGDTDVTFAIESISKIFSLALALEDAGRETILKNVGVYHTGLPFNSIIASDVREVILQNPLVNVGAITTTSYINGTDSNDKWRRELDKFNLFAGRKLTVMEDVFRSEAETNQHNRALAWQFSSFGYLKGDPDDATLRYTRACSVGITCKDLAVMGATLANQGCNPVTGKQVVKKEFVRDILSVMTIAGLYDSTGPFFFRTGLPAKSGVGGGIVAVVPGRFAIATFSPPLDKFGNSARGVKAMTKLSENLELHVLNP